MQTTKHKGHSVTLLSRWVRWQNNHLYYPNNIWCKWSIATKPTIWEVCR